MVCRRAPRHCAEGIVGQGPGPDEWQSEEAPRPHPRTIVESADWVAGRREWQPLHAVLHFQEAPEIPLLCFTTFHQEPFYETPWPDSPAGARDRKPRHREAALVPEI